MTTLTLDLPQEILDSLQSSPEELDRELRLAVAVYWYYRGRISQGTAAQIAGYNRQEFLERLAKEKMDVFVVDLDDLHRELECG